MRLSSDDIHILLAMFEEKKNKRPLYSAEVNLVGRLQKLRSELYMTRETIVQGIATEIESEDGGQSLTAQISKDDDEENGLFVRIMSWDENMKHTDFNNLIHLGDDVTLEISSRALRAGEPSGLPDGDVNDN